MTLDRHQLGRYRIDRNTQSGDLLILAEGARQYKRLLARAFPDLFFSRAFDDRYGDYAWGTYVKGATGDDETRLAALLALLARVFFLEDDLDECYALDLHTRSAADSGFERSEVGRLVRRAKPYGARPSNEHRQAARSLAETMAGVVASHPTYQRADLIVPVPGSSSEKSYDLARALAEDLATLTETPLIVGAVSRTRTTQPMKDLATAAAKIDNVRAAFRASVAVREKVVLLVDDVYQTGFTINEVGNALREAGARMVLGLVATKTGRDLDEGDGS